jgi:hypothetical protein
VDRAVQLFPALISPSFSDGLSIAFDFAIAACLIAGLASLLRGKRYIHEEDGQAAAPQDAMAPVAVQAGTTEAAAAARRPRRARSPLAKAPSRPAQPSVRRHVADPLPRPRPGPRVYPGDRPCTSRDRVVRKAVSGPG